jgi:hypothetical protein
MRKQKRCFGFLPGGLLREATTGGKGRLAPSEVQVTKIPTQIRLRNSRNFSAQIM